MNATASEPSVMTTLAPQETTGGDQTTPLEVQRDLDIIIEAWRSYGEMGLDVRHDIGVRINRRLGRPGQRKPYRKMFVQSLVEGLKLSEADVRGMRRLANHYPDFKKLKEEHPEVKSWADFKVLLPSLRPQTAGAKAASAERAKAQAVRGLERCLDHLATKFRQVDMSASGSEKDKLVKGLERLAESVPDCLNVRVSVERLSGG